jgi:hypothetical protein
MGDRKGLYLWNRVPPLSSSKHFLNKTTKEFEHELIEILIESSFLHITASAHPLDVALRQQERNLLGRLSNRLKMELNALEMEIMWR